MTSKLDEELKRLSKAATQGVWEHSFRGGHTSEGEITCGEHSVITVNGGNYAQWRDAPDDGEAEFKANGDFVTALVNAYRDGQLVLAQPSGDVVEAVAHKLETAFVVQMEAQADDTTPSSIHREQGRVWLEGWFDLNTALSNALDAVRGKP